MPRFFFHLENRHDAIHDSEGVEADHLELAVEQALSAVTELRSEGILPATDDAWTLVICDERNDELKRITVR